MTAAKEMAEAWLAAGLLVGITGAYILAAWPTYLIALAVKGARKDLT